MSCSPASSSPKLSNSNSLSNLRSAGISVPSRPSGHIRKDSSGSINEQSASHSQSKEHAASGAFTPGGAVPSGYSYLTRSHSLVTATRSRPRGMDVQPQSPKQSTDQSIPRSVTTDSVFTASQGRSQHSTSRPLPPIPTSQSSSSIQNKSSVGSNSPSPLPSPSLTQSQGAPPRRSKTIHSFPSNEELGGIKSDAETLEALVSQLPPNPKQWTPSQVALYLSHVLGLTPRPIVEDVTAYVRNSRMGGRVFLRLREEDLEKEGLNLKWRSLMMEAVRKLRRNCLRGRIWGFQGSAGSGWPRTLDDEEEITAPRDIEGQVTEEPDENPESSKTNNKGTLKRLRERRRVRGMIQALDSASENGMEDEEEGFVALGHGGGSRSGSGGSFEHRQGSSNGNGSPRQVMAPIYGHGFVKERAASFTSLSDVENDEQPRRRQARKVEISPAELEEWFGTLSEQEAAALASELEDEDLHGFGDTESESESVGHDEEVGEEKVKETQVINKNQSSHDRAQNNSTGTSSIGSSISGPQTPPPVYVSIEEQEQSMKDLLRQSESSAVRQDNPLDQRLGLVLDQDEAVGISTARPRRREVPRNSSNPYRASTYTPEELAALPSDEDAPRFGTARRIPSGGTPAVNESIPSLAQVVADPEAGAEADNESEDEGFTLKRPTPTNSEQVKENSNSIDDLFPPRTYRSARDLFDAPSPPRRALSGEKAEEELEVKDEEIPSVDINSIPIPTASPSPNHMRNMSQHSAAGASPYAPLGRRSSQKKNTSEASTPSSGNKATEAGAQRTLGSKRATQLAALLRAGGVDEETGNPLGAAEEEGKGAWGGTLSRSVSKKTGGRGSLASMMTSATSSSSASSTTTIPNKGAAKMLELFSPAKEISDPILENQSEEQVEGDASSKSKADELPIIEEPKLEVVTEESSASGNTEKLELIEEEIEAQQEIIEAAVAEAANAEKSGSGLKVRLPMTTLVPSPDGKGSIKKRSMVLVDRARFESLARRMGMLEEQLAALENASEVGSTTSHSREVSRTKLSDIFNSEEASENGGSVRSVKEIETQTSGPSTPRKTYAENSVGNDATKVDEEEEEFSESEGWGAFSLGNPKLSLGAIPAYCLGLGAGVGFIILTEVVQRVARR